MRRATTKESRKSHTVTITTRRQVLSIEIMGIMLLVPMPRAQARVL